MPPNCLVMFVLYYSALTKRKHYFSALVVDIQAGKAASGCVADGLAGRCLLGGDTHPYRGGSSGVARPQISTGGWAGVVRER